MRVWVTRTEPGATRLAAVLAEHGFDAFRCPVLHVEPTLAEAPRGPFAVAVFVSEHAVRHGWRNGIAAAFAAIGETTRGALSERGAHVAWPAFADAAGVADALRAAPPARTLVVKGEGGRDTLQRRLRARGGAALDWNVYRRVAAESVDLAGQRIDAIVASSGEGLRRVAAHWFAREPSARQPFAQEPPAVVPLLVPSQRVAALARDAGFATVRCTDGASAPAVLAALRELEEEASNG